MGVKRIADCLKYQRPRLDTRAGQRIPFFLYITGPCVPDFKGIKKMRTAVTKKYKNNNKKSLNLEKNTVSQLSQQQKVPTTYWRSPVEKGPIYDLNS